MLKFIQNKSNAPPVYFSSLFFFFCLIVYLFLGFFGILDYNCIAKNRSNKKKVSTRCRNE